MEKEEEKNYPKEEEINEEKEIPNEKEKNIEIEETKMLTLDNCDITAFFKKECKIISKKNEKRKELITNIIKNIQDGSFNDIISTLINEEKNIIIEDEKDIYSFGFLENQNLTETKTLIDLDDCEKELKRIYNISDEEKLLIFKIEKYIPGYKIPIPSFELFTQNGEINLDLNYCKNIKTNIYTKVNIDENEIFKYDPNDEYYHDRCNQYTTENGTDITLFDRKNDYNENNMSLCEINCEYQGYDIKNKIVKCECNIKNTKSFFEDKNLLLNEFKNVKEILNIYVIKCYKSVFSLAGLNYNLGSYIIISLFLITIICMIIIK